MSNVKSQHQADVRKKLQRLLGSCAKSTGLRGKLIVLIYGDGRIEIKGGSPAFRRCVQNSRTIERLQKTLPRQMLVDAGRPAIIEVTIS